MENEEDLLEEIQAGLLKWFDFVPGSRALCIGMSCEPIAVDMAQREVHVTCASLEESVGEAWASDHSGEFLYIVSAASLEHSPNPGEALHAWRNLLQENGRMFLGMNNRLGIRYFCGDRDPYTERNFDGIENYRQIGMGKGRMYSREETKRMLQEAGWDSVKCYSVLPDLSHPFLMYAENFLPNESMGNRVFPTYNNPDTVFLREEGIYADLIENGMFHSMANAFLFECSVSGEGSDVLHVTCSAERGREDALLTIIHGNGTVEKRAVYQEGKKRLAELARNQADLEEHGVPVVSGKLEGNCYIMPFIKAETGQLYLEHLLVRNKENFLREMDRFRDLVLHSSEQVRGSEEGIILRNGYVDMVPLNSFYVRGEFLFYDQEFRMDSVPANMIIWRMISSFYGARPDLQKILSMDELCERYGLSERLGHWREMEEEFISRLRRKKELSAHYRRVCCEESVVRENRCRMNYSAKEYRKRFLNTFENIGQRKLVLFGSGRIAKRFLDTYGKEYPVHAVLDNDGRKWGERLAGIEVQSPEILRGMEIGTYYVVVCIKKCMPILEQLEGMGVFSYCVFEPSRTYRRKQHPIALADTEAAGQKKFHIGYVAGVFDLFHIGHLNLFKRAKKQCDYLVVGVVTDEQVREGKQVEPFIPFEERMEIVRSCRYVDEVVEIPFDACETWDAWRMYRFDVQFSGSDYEHDGRWMKKKKFLEEHGAAMVFFPYTESTSSTKLKAVIESRIHDGSISRDARGERS